MSVVTLVSGGLDSTLMAVLAAESHVPQFPLFIDYGQISKDLEFSACKRNLKRLGLPPLEIAGLSGFGHLISSGLTDPSKRVFEDAFTPCRNLMFLLIGSAYAYQRNVEAVAIGLLNEGTSIFPDQTKTFIVKAEEIISFSLGRELRVLAPLMNFSKSDVVRLAKMKGIDQTYSCHAGAKKPCGTCVACREFAGLED